MKPIKFTKQEVSTIEFLINNEQRDILHYRGALMDPKKRYNYKMIMRNILRKIERL